MEALMEQLRTSGGGHVPGASTRANPQPESAYDVVAFLPLPLSPNPGGMTAPLRGISQRATATPYPFSTYTLGNMTTNVATP